MKLINKVIIIDFLASLAAVVWMAITLVAILIMNSDATLRSNFIFPLVVFSAAIMGMAISFSLYHYGHHNKWTRLLEQEQSNA